MRAVFWKNSKGKMAKVKRRLRKPVIVIPAGIRVMFQKRFELSYEHAGNQDENGNLVGYFGGRMPGSSNDENDDETNAENQLVPEEIDLEPNSTRGAESETTMSQERYLHALSSKPVETTRSGGARLHIDRSSSDDKMATIAQLESIRKDLENKVAEVEAENERLWETICVSEEEKRAAELNNQRKLLLSYMEILNLRLECVMASAERKIQSARLAIAHIDMCLEVNNSEVQSCMHTARVIWEQILNDFLAWKSSIKAVVEKQKNDLSSGVIMFENLPRLTLPDTLVPPYIPPKIQAIVENYCKEADDVHRSFPLQSIGILQYLSSFQECPPTLRSREPEKMPQARGSNTSEPQASSSNTLRPQASSSNISKAHMSSSDTSRPEASSSNISKAHTSSTDTSRPQANSSITSRTFTPEQLEKLITRTIEHFQVVSGNENYITREEVLTIIARLEQHIPENEEIHMKDFFESIKAMVRARRGCSSQRCSPSVSKKPWKEFEKMMEKRKMVFFGNEQCVICQEEMTLNDVLKQCLQCGKHFHAKCVLPWLSRQSTCPICRTHWSSSEEYPRLPLSSAQKRL